MRMTLLPITEFQFLSRLDYIIRSRKTPKKKTPQKRILFSNQLFMRLFYSIFFSIFMP